MKLKSKRTVNYTINGRKKQMVVIVELKQIDGMGNSFRNIYEGFATLNENEYEHPDLPFCVNAEYMVESIMDDEFAKLRKKYGEKLRIKNYSVT